MTKGTVPILGLIICMHTACIDVSETKLQHCDKELAYYHKYALLSSRINDLEELRKVIEIEYLQADSVYSDDQVNLSFCSELGMIYSELKDGLSQEDVMKAQKGDLYKRWEVLLEEPSLVQNRNHLKDIYLLSRRRHDVYGYGDVAFYDLALEASKKIKVDENAYSFERDSSEKGYINTFNHITAQAFITSIYSRDIADLVADVHERYNMPEIINGDFSQEQLEDFDNNPVDNYVDVINNEVGQLLGENLKNKYGIQIHQQWTPTLLCNYLNDLQAFYSKAFQVQMSPFEEEDRVVSRFCEKLNDYFKLNYKLNRS